MMGAAAELEDAEGEGAVSDATGNGVVAELGGRAESPLVPPAGGALAGGVTAGAASTGSVGMLAIDVAAAGGGSVRAAQRHSSSTGRASDSMPTAIRP